MFPPCRTQETELLVPFKELNFESNISGLSILYLRYGGLLLDQLLLNFTKNYPNVGVSVLLMFKVHLSGIIFKSQQKRLCFSLKAP